MRWLKKKQAVDRNQGINKCWPNKTSKALSVLLIHNLKGLNFQLANSVGGSDYKLDQVMYQNPVEPIN